MILQCPMSALKSIKLELLVVYLQNKSEATNMGGVVGKGETLGMPR